MDANITLMLIEALLIVLDIAIYKAIKLFSPLLDHVIHPSGVDDSCKDDVVSISTASSPSAHTTVAPPATKYDVFLSFRGEDTRDHFTSYLYKELCNANIETFLDHKLSKGEQISTVLLKTIEESEISVIIFSEDYASSTWCMDELVHILECEDHYGRIVIPVFYNVEPSDIRKQRGSFGDGFAKLKQRFEGNQDKVQKWRNALNQSTSLSGWDSKNIKPEPKLIKKIVEDILSKLNGKSSFHVEGLVGINHQIEKIEELLNEVRIVGIWGMDGIGKTTLAKAVFRKLKAQFESFSFIENVRERLARIGLEKLQGECLNELLTDKEIDKYNINSTFMKRRLQRKKILLVFDDVDNSITVEHLTKVCDWFGEGSRIIMTSRDMQVLKNASASTTYHVLKLEFPHALHLFSLKAFKQNKPIESYMELSNWVVDYCQGNPLALVVLGCFLHRRRKEEWESALEKLKQAPDKDIFNVLKLSFDGLDDNQKNVFLDLAFVIKEVGHQISVDLIRHLYDTSVHIQISVLEERSLILSFYGGIKMHDLLRKMGLEIARQQLHFGPGNPVRLWRHEDIDYFFINNKGIEAIRCISLDMSKVKRISLLVGNFQKMYNLRYLKFYGKMLPKVDICENLDHLPKDLRFLYWEEYPRPYVPLSFCAENLVNLEMRCSYLQQLWEGDQHFPNLQFINLSNSEHLIRIPDLSQAPNVKSINLSGRVKLVQIHSSTVLGKLKHLLLFWCEEIKYINIGGTIKWRSSGLVVVYQTLDLKKFSLKKVTVKLFVSDDGNIISGIRFKQELVPFKRISNLKLRTQRLASLLPFVCKVGWFDNVEFGNFNQHFDYDQFGNFVASIRPRRKGLVVERIVPIGMVGALRRERVHADDKEEGRTLEVEEEDKEEELADDKEEGRTLEVEEEEEEEELADDKEEGRTLEVEEEEEEELMGRVLECCCSDSSSNTLLTRSVPNNITRWSLLTELTLKKCDIIGNAGCSLPQVSVLKIVAQSGYCKRQLQPLIDATLSLDTAVACGFCPTVKIHNFYGCPLSLRTVWGLIWFFIKL